MNLGFQTKVMGWWKMVRLVQENPEIGSRKLYGWAFFDVGNRITSMSENCKGGFGVIGFDSPLGSHLWRVTR